ncbi:MAG: aminotransferase class V-fold PLP-dependent enzyme, partial [Fulvivirga sp.]|nr:aminotransferase class V-fold PLP-dependent enzyme [Fulvivirga sp.]
MKHHKPTQCVHTGTIKDPATKGSVSPVYPASAYDYLDVEIKAYPRYFNTPNQRAVAEKIAALENGEEGMVFSSGMAAISTVLFALLKRGDHAVFQNDLYGGTHHAISREMDRHGINYDMVDSIDPQQFEQKITDKTKLIYIETPSNPLMKIMDIEAIAQLAKNNNIISVIDNTFASPINQNPIDMGIDVVIHSGTKYLGGHSDICCGAVVTTEDIMSRIWDTAINYGGSLNAQMCALLERSLKTLALRVQQQNANAQAIASYLSKHSK